MFRNTMRSCATWLCSRLRSSAVGTYFGSLARNTAVPGTRGTPSSSFGSCVSGTATARSAARSSRRPLRQIMNTLNSTIASVSGTQAPSRELGQVAHQVDQRRCTISGPNTASTRQGCQRHCAAASCMPSMRGDEHRAGDCRAVGGAERGRGAEAQHEQAHRDQHQPVHHRHVDLAVLVRRGLRDAQARQQIELDALARHRERAGDRRLRGDDRGGRGQQYHQRQQRPAAPAGRAAGAPPPDCRRISAPWPK